MQRRWRWHSGAQSEREANQLLNVSPGRNTKDFPSICITLLNLLDIDSFLLQFENLLREAYADLLLLGSLQIVEDKVAIHDHSCPLVAGANHAVVYDQRSDDNIV